MFDIMSSKVYGNKGVLFFIIMLGMIVHLMNMSGATHEYAKLGKGCISENVLCEQSELLQNIFCVLPNKVSCLS